MAGSARPKPVPYAPAASEDLLAGARLLRQAFLDAPHQSAGRDQMIVPADDPEPPALLIDSGFAFRAICLASGRRSIVDILVPMEMWGLDHAVLGSSHHEIVAVDHLSYRLLSAAKVRELIHHPAIALRTLALAGEARCRADRHLMEVTRLDSRGRLAAMLIDIYERLRRHGLISRPTFNLPMTQDQIADYLGLTNVHVSRTLRKLREEKLAIVDRQVVILLDLDQLRQLAAAFPAALTDEEAVPEHALEKTID